MAGPPQGLGDPLRSLRLKLHAVTVRSQFLGLRPDAGYFTA